MTSSIWYDGAILIGVSSIFLAICAAIASHIERRKKRERKVNMATLDALMRQEEYLTVMDIVEAIKTVDRQPSDDPEERRLYKNRRIQ